MDQISIAGREANLTRRALLARMGAGIAALKIVTVAGVLTPKEAQAQGVPLAYFTEAAAGAFEALGDVLVPGAKAAGVAHSIDTPLVAAEIRHNSVVTRVLTTPDGERATGVEYVDATGAMEVQEAEVVILGAFAIQSPRLLLNSATDKHPDGLANRSGTVGQYLMAHPIGSSLDSSPTRWRITWG